MVYKKENEIKEILNEEKEGQKSILILFKHLFFLYEKKLSDLIPDFYTSEYLGAIIVSENIFLDKNLSLRYLQRNSELNK